MQVSKEEFFRQITLRICGSLQIEQALRRTFDYLREGFPVDKLFLEVFDTSLGAVRRIAHESAVKDDAPEEIVPLSSISMSLFVTTFPSENIFKSKKAPQITLRGFSCTD